MPRITALRPAYDAALLAGLDHDERRLLAARLLIGAETARRARMNVMAEQLELDAISINPLLIH